MSFGLVKHNNNSISAITTAGQLASGKLVLIKEQTASSSSSISFVDGSGGVVLDNTYPIYIFKFINMHPATDAAQFSFQGSTNTGGAYGVTITSTHFSAYHNEAGDTTNLGYDGTGNRDLAQSTNFQVLASATGNQNDESFSGTLYLFDLSSSTFVKHFIATGNHYNRSDYSINNHMAGYLNTTSAIDAIQFKMDSGNIDSGTIKLYGLQDS
mgnify:CR=1 FL=1|tara:strand:- start:573 stop:1208 length:636 start_codon:yes stop_codon:yes gene_type:complete